MQRGAEVRDRNKHGYMGITSVSPGRALVRIVEQIARLGYRPVVFMSGGSRSGTKSTNLEKLAELFPTKRPTCIASMHDIEEQPVAASKYFVAEVQRRRLKLVDWINITDQTTIAYLLSVDKLGLTFPFFETYVRCRIKPIARTLAKQAGCTGHGVVDMVDINGVIPLIKRGSRLVVKPITGSASRGVRKIRSNAEMTSYLRQARSGTRFNAKRAVFRGYDLAGQFLLEHELTGIELEIDGYVCDGEVTICAIGSKVHQYRPDHGFREIGGMICSVGSSRGAKRQRERRIISWTKRLLHALDFSSGVFHIEAMETPLGEIELIEVNPRLGGGSVVEMVEKVSGVNLLDVSVPLWLKKPLCMSRSKPCARAIVYAICYPTRAGLIEVRDAAWSVQWKKGVPVTRSDLAKESYVGEFHVHLDDDGEVDMAHTVLALQRWVRAGPLIEE
jgi:hypothetical protein